MQTTIVILENVRSAFNVGAIFRSCDASHVEELHLIGITPKPPLDKLIKTSVGAVDFVNWKYFKTIDESIYYLREKFKDIEIVSIEQNENSISLLDVVLKKPQTAFIFGHEINGVSKNAIDQSDKVVELPMLGKKNSLNVATTVGIILYDRLKQTNLN